MFLIRAKGRSGEDILQILNARLENSDAQEVQAALEQLREITLLRGRSYPRMSTLSTHILDISTGKPAAGVTVHLEREGETMATGVTNVNGRITEFVPFLPAGRYRLVAEIGGWFRATGRGDDLPLRAN